MKIKQFFTPKRVLLLLLLLLAAAAAAGVVGMLLGAVLFNNALLSGGSIFDPRLLLDGQTWLLGGTVILICAALYLALGRHSHSFKKLLGGEAKGVDSPLEHSRFLTDAARDKYFPGFDFANAAAAAGVPFRFE